MVGVEPSQLDDVNETETLVSEAQPRESSVFSITETEKYILKQIMDLTQDREGLQVSVLSSQDQSVMRALVK